ncbi:hypothetical protein [Sphingomonas sp.]|uniref:hypothetical protein n=1 Tax=Sphingomonas sp. TaxID=28214 RepID=UPI002FD8CA99
MIASALALLRTRTGQIGAAVLVTLIGFGVWLAFHDRKVIARHEAGQQQKAAPATARADADRAKITAIIANDTQEVKNALDKLPDAPLTDRQRARFCATWMRQHGTPCPPAR